VPHETSMSNLGLEKHCPGLMRGERIQKLVPGHAARTIGSMGAAALKAVLDLEASPSLGNFLLLDRVYT
jgi:hypothetical protein